jgi:formylglycine-generating enzyme required for sulfatase activity/uncharacterized caspase-like protein
MSGNRDVSWQTGGLTGSVTKRRETRWRADSYAVIVGIDAYSDPRIPNLRFARKDAEAVYKVLTDPAVGRFSPDNVITLLDGDATERKIRSALGTKLPRLTSKTSTVCIYYAGHGAPVIDVDAKRRSADNIEKYLVPHDAEADDLRSTAISMDSIQQYFSWLDAKQVICFLDTCYSGGAGGRSFERDLHRPRAIFSDEHLDRLAGEGRVVMTACETNEISLESSEKGHGLFTYYLVRGLQGDADANGDGRVTVDELYDYVYHHVDRDARLMDGRMSPVRKGSVRGRVYLTEYGTTSGEAVAEKEPLSSDDEPASEGSTAWGHRRKRVAAIVAASIVAVAAAGVWLWMSTRSPGPAVSSPESTRVVTEPIDPVPTKPGPAQEPVAATGLVALEWGGSTDVRWSVVDSGNKIIAEGLAPAKDTSRLSLTEGDFFVLLKDFPRVRLPVTVVAGRTMTVKPPVGRLEVAWSGTNAVNAIVEDENGKVLRKDWQIPSKGSRVMDLGEGRYSIVLPNMSPRSVTVAPGSPVRLNLEPDAPAPAPIPPVSPTEKIATPPGKPEPENPPVTVKPAPKLPYVPGQFKLPNTDDLGFVLIEAGSFLMGSDPNRHRAALLNERPQIAVNLPAFFMGKYEVTVDQYKACVEDGGCAANPSAVSGPVDRPVRHVSWDDAVQYCLWLDRKLREWTGTPRRIADALSGASGAPAWKVRLPSEAEWEKAARGTTNRIYPWGDSIDPSRANYNNQFKEPTIVGTHPSGASPFGLLDMSGNVWEWTRSRLLRYPYRVNNDREDTRPSKNTERVIRGGSFQTDDPWAARRNTGAQSERTDFIGFRVAVGPPQ